MPIIYFLLGLFIGMAGTYVGRDEDLENVPNYQIVLSVIAMIVGMGLIFFAFHEATKPWRDLECSQPQVQIRQGQIG